MLRKSRTSCGRASRDVGNDKGVSQGKASRINSDSRGAATENGREPTPPESFFPRFPANRLSPLPGLEIF